MSLNDEQIDWMRHLATIPPAERCYCGWNPIGKCYNCPPEASLEQRLKVQCPNCQNYPHLGGKPTITHNIKCSSQDWQPATAEPGADPTNGMRATTGEGQ